MKNALVLIAVIFILTLVGCAGGLQKTAQEPLHTQSGLGVTLWKIPILGLGIWAPDDWGYPSIVVHQYNYSAMPITTPAGTLPNLSTAGPPMAGYQTIYGSAWDDPTLVVFKNNSYFRKRIAIDGQRPIILEPYGVTPNMHFGVGRHQVRVVTEKPTRAHGTLEAVRVFSFSVRPEGRSQIIHLYNH